MLAPMGLTAFPLRRDRFRAFGRLAAVLAALLAIRASAFAASNEAWRHFRSDVETSCREAAVGLLDDPVVVVDPYGSQHYGLAVLTGRESGTRVIRSVVCVYDKQDLTAEVGGPLILDRPSAAPAMVGEDADADPSR